jgi:hypothetical protein
MQAGIECPECCKHSVIQKSDSVYLCLGCGWKKDLNPPPSKKTQLNVGAIAAIGLTTFLILSQLSQLRSSSINSSPQLKSAHSGITLPQK